MPPPIAPASGSGMRAPIARLTEKSAAQSFVRPRQSIVVRPGQPINAAASGAGRAAAFREGGFGNRGRESGAARYVASGERPSAERAVRPVAAACREDAAAFGAGAHRGAARRGRRPAPAEGRTPVRALSRRRKSTIPSPISNCSRRKWRVCSAAKSLADPRRSPLRHRGRYARKRLSRGAQLGAPSTRRSSARTRANRHSSR